MQRLTDDVDIDVEEGHLQLHGKRRGLGDLRYRQDHGHARDTRRHDDLSTTKPSASTSMPRNDSMYSITTPNGPMNGSNT